MNNLTRNRVKVHFCNKKTGEGGRKLIKFDFNA